MHKEHAKARRPHRVALLACDGVSPFEFSIACEIFGCPDHSDLAPGWYEFQVCGPAPVVKTSLGFELKISGTLADLETADTVIVAPVHDTKRGHVGEAVLDALRRAHAGGARIVSLCSGAFVLASAGLLDGRPATTHWQHAAELALEHPSISVDPRVLYVDDGEILTSAGSAASIDLCLHIVRKDFGADFANVLARSLVVPPHRDGGQAQFIEAPMPQSARDDLFGEVLGWARAHIIERLTVEELAKRAAMSPRTFARRFRSATGTTPHKWLLQQRIELARRLLETTELTVDHVADASGLGSAANLRLHFDEVVGLSPGAYRKRFRRLPAA